MPEEDNPSENPDNDDKHKSIWNNSQEYFQLMSSIEREMINAKVRKDYILLDEYMDDYWIELSEWFTDNEVKIHDDLRDEQKKAYKIVVAAVNAGKKTVSNEVVEVYIRRWRALLRTFHTHGMRSITKDREEDMGLLARKPKFNFNRHY